MFRAVLAAVKPEGTQGAVIEYAVSIAARHKLTLIGLSDIDSERLAPAEPLPIGATAFKADRDQHVVAAAREAAAALQTRLESECRRRGVACEIHTRDGDVVDVVAAESQHADVVVCGRTSDGISRERAILRAILKHCPRPTVVVPDSTQQSARADSDIVLIAYDGSYQAARALAAFASSGLATGRTVHIASFATSIVTADAIAATAQSYLERHEIAAEVHTGQVVTSAAEAILDEARQLRAGLIVMGAFGLSAAREFLFGSTTRTILDAASIPVFLDH